MDIGYNIEADAYKEFWHLVSKENCRFQYGTAFAVWEAVYSPLFIVVVDELATECFRKIELGMSREFIFGGTPALQEKSAGNLLMSKNPLSL